MRVGRFILTNDEIKDALAGKRDDILNITSGMLITRVEVGEMVNSTLYTAYGPMFPEMHEGCHITTYNIHKLIKEYKDGT